MVIQFCKSWWWWWVGTTSSINCTRRALNIYKTEESCIDSVGHMTWRSWSISQHRSLKHTRTTDRWKPLSETTWKSLNSSKKYTSRRTWSMPISSWRSADKLLTNRTTIWQSRLHWKVSASTPSWTPANTPAKVTSWSATSCSHASLSWAMRRCTPKFAKTVRRNWANCTSQSACNVCWG